MNKNDRINMLWNEFKNSGKIEDYLNYTFSKRKNNKGEEKNRKK